jgi:hypothetical protein
MIGVRFINPFKKRKVMFGNYKYSLRSTEQAEIQEFLRRLPKYLWQTAGWQLLHDLTYAPSWTQEPKYDSPESLVPTVQECLAPEAVETTP